MTLAFSSPLISLLLIPMLVAPPGWSQTPLPAASTDGVLHVKVLDGDVSPVPAGSRSSKGFSVQVTDENGVGIADVAVAIRLPDSGASGLFADSSHAAVVYTDAAGTAHVDSIQWNGTAGVATMRITATKGDRHAGILLEKTLVSTVATVTAAAPHLQAGSYSPGTLAADSSRSSAANAEDAAPLNTIAESVESLPVRPAIRASAAGPSVAIIRSAEPSVSISSDVSGPAYHSGFNKKKWIIIGLAIAAGAGAAYAASSLMKGGSTASGSSSISIGAPTVSVGHP